MDFSSILRQGKKRFKVKNNRGKYGNCEYCDDRFELFPYSDTKNEIWMLCESCTDIFVKEEE
jgi:hypothetical protein